MPTSTEREKRELEEIAHLFLSTRREQRKTRPPPVQNVSAVAPVSVAPRTAGPGPFWIRPRAVLHDEDWVDSFLLNLALLFQLADEPVVWIPSRRPPWSSSERGLPAQLKARLAGVASAGLPLSYCGPMGLRVFPATLWETTRRDSEGVGRPSGQAIGADLAAYRYVLASEPLGPLPWEVLPCLELWLVGAGPAASGPVVEAQSEFEGPFQYTWAFVVLGAASEDEARAAGRQWKEMQGLAVSGKGDPEYLGFVPGPFPALTALGRQGMIVLESPLSWQTRRLQEIASRIRARRPPGTAAGHERA